MKKFLLIILLAVFHSGVFAQSSGAASDEAYKAKVTRMIEVSGANKTFEAIIPQLTGMFKAQYSSIPDKVWDALETTLTSSFPELLEALIPVYQKYYTLSDLDELIKFYESPIGQKSVNANAQMMGDILTISQEWGQSLSKKIIYILTEEGYTI